MTKNSILLVDFRESLRKQGMAHNHPTTAHKKPLRLRPVLMTSLALILS